MMSRLLFTCLILLLPATISAQEIHWRPSVEVAAAQSHTTGKPMLLHFSADWCRPCSELKRFVLADSEVITTINEQTVPVLIDTDTHPELVKHYSITNLPTDVLVAPGDRVIFLRNSPPDRKRWLEMLETGLAASKSMADLDTADHETLVELNKKWEESRKPAPDEFKIDDFHMQKPFRKSADLLLAKPAATTFSPADSTDVANDQAIADVQPNTTAESVSARFSLPETATLIDSASEETTQSAAVAPTSQFYANSESGPAESRHDENVLRTPARESKPVSFNNPYVTDNNPGQSSVTVKATANGNVDSVSLDGLCPVTVLEEGSWIAGNPTIGCVHRGRTYLFQSIEKRDRFMANPDRWSPLFAGYDPVDFANSGRLVDGQRTFGIFMNTPDGQQVVLFSRAINQAEFKASAGKFMQAIQKATQEADAKSASPQR